MKFFLLNFFFILTAISSPITEIVKIKYKIYDGVIIQFYPEVSDLKLKITGQEPEILLNIKVNDDILIIGEGDIIHSKDKVIWKAPVDYDSITLLLKASFFSSENSQLISINFN